METLLKKAKALQTELSEAQSKIGLDGLVAESAKIAEQMNNPDFWNDNKKAGELSKNRANLEQQILPWQELGRELSEIIQLLEIGDETINDEIDANLESIQVKLNELKKSLRFNGPYDRNNVIMSIYAGAGGTDAQDWASMLMRMYLRWCEQNSITTKIIDESSGEEAGIKSVTIEIDGLNAYGKLKGENGVHRLVRLSPFNSDNLRQTSFAKVDILPEIEQPEELEIDEKDLKIDVYRSGGHGGQSVNTTDSAVRITHTPTGISVAIQNERSQLQNKETAMKILRSKLIQLQLEQHAEKLSELKGENEQAAWGNQIRSYVLHPYKQVKDLRSGHTETDTDGVLDGKIDNFIDSLF